jgi:hypothetical protein
MLDNLSGSGLSESEVVQKMQAARDGASEESEQVVPTDEGDEESQVDAFEDEAASEGEIESEEYFEDQEEPEFYTVKVNGEDREVSFDNLLENYSKGEDYTKKTMALADERKALDTEKEQLVSAIEAEKQKFLDLSGRLEAVIKDSEQSINWEELRDTDPSEYLRQKEIQDNRVKELEAAQKLHSEELTQNRQKLIQSESEKLLQVMGDHWKDPEVKQKDLEGMYGYAYSRGVTQEEANKILDHRFWLMVHDAMKYQELKKTGEVVKKEVKKAPKMIKSGKPMKRQQQVMKDSREKLRASGGKDLDAAVALLKAKRNR